MSYLCMLCWHGLRDKLLTVYPASAVQTLEGQGVQHKQWCWPGFRHGKKWSIPMSRDFTTSTGDPQMTAKNPAPRPEAR